MIITSGHYKPVAIRWDTVSLPLRAGTPISAAGLVANDGTALGLVPQTVTVRPVLPELQLLTAGEVKLGEAEQASGLTLSAAARRAMAGIRFVDSRGGAVELPVYELPDATPTQAGIVKQAANVAAVTPADETATALETAVNDILSALKAAGLMAADAS